jgi:hypothetical protein
LVTILVDPLIKHKEIRVVKMLRKLERLFVKPAKKIFSQKHENQE